MHIVAVDQPVGRRRVGADRAALIQKQRAAHGVKAVKAAAQVVFVVAGRLHDGQVDVRPVDAQPADEVGVFLVEMCIRDSG